MDRREELKAKARDHERKQQPEHALEVYLKLVADAPPGGQGGLWTHIGNLQEGIGAVPGAVESYGHAVTAFAESGQLNNAVAVSQRILRLDPKNATAHLRLGEIALTQGYREYARYGIGGYARLAAATDQPQDALEPLAAYLGRFPDEADLWREWEEELLANGKTSEVPGFLQSLRETLTAAGHTEAVERIARELSRFDSSNGSRASSDAPPPLPAEEPASASDSSLPLLETPSARESQQPTRVAPIEGLEPSGSDSYAIDDSDLPEDLPLLGTLPELTTDRADNLDLEGNAAPLAGVERFEFGGGGIGAPEDEQEELTTTSDLPDLPLAGGDFLGREEFARPAPDLLPESEEEDEEDDEYGDDIPFLEPSAPALGASATDSTSDSQELDPAAIADELRAYAGIEVDFSDAASHYDLGLAYKEMDRFDESLANLAMAMQGGHDPAAVLEVAAEILVGRGEFSLADDLLRRIPGVGDHAIPEHLGVHYWLARASEESGRREDARHALELVVSVDPGFRDASDRLRKLV